MPTPTALHSAKTPKWGTPKKAIDWGRELLDGVIHLDPGSSEDFNKQVQALMIYTEHNSGLDPNNPWFGNVFVNPPGGLVNEYWDRLIEYILAGAIDKAFWVGFSVEQLCTLADRAYHPTDFSTCILRKRLAFTTEQGDPGGSPSHGNYVTGLGVSREAFNRLFLNQGKIIHGSLALDFEPLQV